MKIINIPGTIDEINTKFNGLLTLSENSDGAVYFEYISNAIVLVNDSNSFKWVLNKCLLAESTRVLLTQQQQKVDVYKYENEVYIIEPFINIIKSIKDMDICIIFYCDKNVSSSFYGPIEYINKLKTLSNEHANSKEDAKEKNCIRMYTVNAANKKEFTT